MYLSYSDDSLVYNYILVLKLVVKHVNNPSRIESRRYDVNNPSGNCKATASDKVELESC